MMGGKESRDFLAPSGSGENTLVLCERGDYAADLEIASGVPRRGRASRSGSTRPRRSQTPGRDDDRGARGAARDRPGRDLEGDAGHERGRHRRARARPRRRPALRGEARPRRARTPGPRPRRRSARPSAPTPARSAPSGSPARSSPTSRCARASSSPARTGPATTCAASRHGRDFEARFADLREATRGRRVPDVRRRARLPDRDRGRPHLQARHLLLRAARRDRPRRGRRRAADRHGQLRDRARARIVAAAVEQRGDESADRSGRASSRRTTSRSSRSTRATPSSRRRPSRSRPSSMRRAATSSSTTASSGRARSSPTPISSGAPLRIIVGKKTLEDGAVDVRDRTSGEETARCEFGPRKMGSRVADASKAEVQRGAVSARRSSA